ncbi:hypothetical protein [Pseudomonas syringae]|uniref:Uncharacterized protein n=1 Tax=Pseudomonas syringae pv. syringae TaxID=321 RepID=A0A1S6YB25_PSESY|nr:hypothetical protein [Pseudomonas syringae]ALE01103.1 hypothetical protein PSYRMG_25870 [Pseudomonas syringae UMAF0158]AQX42044.1 hypothetical protein [Pseudomonas syringae pv. syringae]AQX42109.1 hypothetical protein [Pseudomonas syringae pv. syringae]MCK9694773.1 hypothetical protein [Pseudomonas syringae pv. syringae]MCK9709735.1 hypothetical protein [Pseudomonas syringae pv. syringae]
MTPPSDLAGNQRFSNVPGAIDLMPPQQRDTFSVLLADIGKATALDQLCEQRGKAIVFAIGLLSCQAIDDDQLVYMKRQAQNAFQQRFHAVQPLED